MHGSHFAVYLTDVKNLNGVWDPALEKWDPGRPSWDPDGTRWDPVGPGLRTVGNGIWWGPDGPQCLSQCYVVIEVGGRGSGGLRMHGTDNAQTCTVAGAQFQGRKQHGKGGTHQSSPSLPSKLPSSPVPCQCSMMDGLFLFAQGTGCKVAVSKRENAASLPAKGLGSALSLLGCRRLALVATPSVDVAISKRENTASATFGLPLASHPAFLLPCRRCPHRCFH